MKIARTLLSLLAVAAASSPAPAKDLYRYQDADGNWQFADRPPATGAAPVEQLQLSVRDTTPRVAIESEDGEASSTLYVVNGYQCPIELVLALVERVNVDADVPQEIRVVAPPGRNALLEIEPERPGARWKFRYAYRFTLGDPEAEHAPVRPYRVPYAITTSFPVTQSFNGPGTFHQPPYEYSVDIAMPIGTSIFAAREGTVVEVAYRNYSGGTDAARDAPRANIVRMLHDDGTFGLYAHLDRSSVRVRPGDRVRIGEEIARSGNTGFSSGPHLHFAVLRNEGMRLVTVPFEFAGANGAGVVPAQGGMLTAYP